MENKFVTNVLEFPENWAFNVMEIYYGGSEGGNANLKKIYEIFKNNTLISKAIWLIFKRFFK